MANCANCPKPCRQGKTEGAMDGCPSKKYSKEESLGLYSEEELKMARASAQVEHEGYCIETRIEEIMSYAYKLGYKKIGLAFCVGLSPEAKIVSDVFTANGFEVESVCCKCGCVPKFDIGLTEADKVHPENDYEGICNPALQAKVLDDANVDLAVMLGLCVGHDTLFLKHINAPVTIFAVKDRVCGHNPLAPIHMAGGYAKRIYKHVEKLKNRKK